MRQEFTATFTGTQTNHFHPDSTLALLTDLCGNDGVQLADRISLYSGAWSRGLRKDDKISFRAELNQYKKRFWDGVEATTVIETRLEKIRKVRVI